MTPQDREMRRHPNRSIDWIPNYLREQRADLQMKLLDYLVGFMKVMKRVHGLVPRLVIVVVFYKKTVITL